MELYPWKAQVHIVGATPLLIHNGRMASPLDVFSKKMKLLTSKRKKTEDDLKNILEIQWEGGLYWDDEIGLHMPTENLLAALLKAYKHHKLGKNITGIVFDEPIGFPIITQNHKNLIALKADDSNKFIKAVTIQRSKTLSCRPIFKKWEMGFEFFIDEEFSGVDEIKMILFTMSQRIGLGVWTPSHPKPGSYGKFLIKSLIFKNSKTGEEKVYENKSI